MSKAVTLPAPEILMERLKDVDKDPHTVEHLYPLIARHGGTSKVGSGLVVLLQLAYSDYIDGQDLPNKGLFWSILNDRIPSYIDALTKDGTVRADAKAFWVEVEKKVVVGV